MNIKVTVAIFFSFFPFLSVSPWWRSSRAKHANRSQIRNDSGAADRICVGGCAVSAPACRPFILIFKTKLHFYRRCRIQAGCIKKMANSLWYSWSQARQERVHLHHLRAVSSINRNGFFSKTSYRRTTQDHVTICLSFNVWTTGYRVHVCCGLWRKLLALERNHTCAVCTAWWINNIV